MSRRTTIQAFTANLAERFVRCPTDRRQWAASTTWRQFVALALLAPIFSWVVIEPTPHCLRDFAKHMAEMGEHTDPYGYHVPPEIEQPQAASFFDVVIVDVLPAPPLIGIGPLDHLARDHPPPLFWSLSHSLRAPPTLIPA